MRRYINLRTISCLLTGGLLFFSCKKQELPVPKHDPGSVITESVNMDASYKWQIYYDLKTNSVVGKNLKTAWDLGFETMSEGYHISLNSSKAMYAYNTKITDFSSINDTTGFAANKKWDVSSGNLDSTAIGNWKNSDHVYIIDRGYSETGTHQGFRKIQFKDVDANKYSIRFSALDGSEETNLEIIKDSAYNFVFLSFDTKNTLKVEPKKETWDLVFTQYLHIFHEPEPTPYLVTGCLLNRYNTPAVMDSTVSFSSIDILSVQDHILSEAINTIGYNWKTFIGSTYLTHSEMNYIIRDSEGLYYKLHFTDFYDHTGVKGNPAWEHQQL